MTQDEGGKMPSERAEGTPLPERIPPPTVWPAALALGITLICFGIVTSWVMSLAGLILFVMSVIGWFEDLREDVQQS